MSSSDPRNPGQPFHAGAGWGPPAGGAPEPDRNPPLARPTLPPSEYQPAAPLGEHEHTTCYVHPQRPGAATCRRCGRPICTDCMREAPVGWQCARCVHNDAKTAPVSRWRPRQAGTLGTSRLTPVVTVLIALNVVIFLIEETNINSIAFRYALIPMYTPGERYRLITAAFLHANVTHIFLNMITLAIIGPAVETAIGKSRFVAVYLLAAFGGEVCSYLIGPLNVESLGASGAIFGLMGAYFVLARRRGWDLSIVVPLIVINLIFSFLDPAIDWRAHVGGLAIGALVALVFSWTGTQAPKVRRAVEPLACVAILVALGALSLLPPGHVNI